MNFQAVRQVKGQKDANNYPEKVDMIGVFVEIGGGAYTTNQKLYCDCQIRDMAQEKHKVRLYIKEAIPLGLLNTECSFSISAYDGEYQGKPYVGYSGFWNDQVLQRPAQGQVTPYQPPQGPQTPLQQSNVPQATQSPGKDVRAKALEIAAILVAAGKHEPIELYGLADFLVDYISEGKHPAGVAGANPPQDDSWMDR